MMVIIQKCLITSLILTFFFSSQSSVAQSIPVLSDSLDKWVNVWWDDKDELIAVQWKGLNEEDRLLQLRSIDHTLVQQTQLYTGSTIAYFDTQILYAGDYWLMMEIGGNQYSKKIVIKK